MKQKGPHNRCRFYPQTAQNHQQPDQSFPVEGISARQQGCHFCAAPTKGVARRIDPLHNLKRPRSYKPFFDYMTGLLALLYREITLQGQRARPDTIVGAAFGPGVFGPSVVGAAMETLTSGTVEAIGNEAENISK